MSWILALHIIAMTAWFAGLFYLPRLFVYHAETSDTISLQRFKIMERRLYFGIMWPAAILTITFGFILLHANPNYLTLTWMQLKLFFVLLLLIYHLFCWKYLIDFRYDRNQRSTKFFRIFNEIPTVLLIVIVILVVVQPRF